METQKLLTKYVAEMSDIYIPEEEEDVQDITEIERQNQSGRMEENGRPGKGTWKADRRGI